MGLLVRGEPDVEIEGEEKSYVVETDDETNEQVVKIEMDVETEVNKSKYIYMTRFAIYFVEYCKFEATEKKA